MRKIELRGGYHEWLIVVDDKIAYSFSIEYEELEDEHRIKVLADDIIYFMQEDFKEYDNGTYRGFAVGFNPHFTEEETNF